MVDQLLRINLNIPIRVNLTGHGLESLKSHISKYEGHHVLEEHLAQYRQEDGSYRFQLWEAFEIFGPRMIMGTDPEFEGNVLYTDWADECVKLITVRWEAEVYPSFGSYKKGTLVTGQLNKQGLQIPTEDTNEALLIPGEHILRVRELPVGEWMTFRKMLKRKESQNS